MSHSTEGPEVSATLGKFCKIGPSQGLDIAFIHGNFKGCCSEN